MIQLYAAYSQAKDAHAMQTAHPSDVTTASRAKRLLGLANDAWIYVSLPKHNFDAKCKCHYCTHYKAGWFARPPWASADWTVDPYPYVRCDIGSKNARLNLPHGSYVIGVALHDMQSFALDLERMGMTGMLFALYWYQSGDCRGLRE